MKSDLRKKLVLHKETLRALKVKTGIRRGITRRSVQTAPEATARSSSSESAHGHADSLSAVPQSHSSRWRPLPFERQGGTADPASGASGRADAMGPSGTPTRRGSR